MKISGIQAYFHISEFRRKGAQGHTFRKRSYSWYDTGNSGFHRLRRYSGKRLLFTRQQFFLIVAILFQVRFALCSSSVFSRTDTVTDSERFYNTILDLFDDTEEQEEVKDLLVWWNRYDWFNILLLFRSN